MKDPSITTAATVTASEFRAKVAQMKNWTPNRTPTNRDRLELYALHKQAVASDAPETSTSTSTSTTSSPSPSTSPAERAKLNAWKTKRGLSQSQAMAAYINEADRQICTYGTLIPNTTTPTNTPNDDSGSGARSRNGNRNGSGHAPEEHERGDASSGTGTSSVLLTPRGLAAVPLLCAAASESRGAYLKRLEQNAAASSSPSSSSSMHGESSGEINGGGGGGWWMRQEPLCGDPGTISALPEILVLTIAILVERLSLHLSSTRGATKDMLDTLALRPGVVQSILWPLHNVLLVVWILVIFLSTVTGSAILTVKTLLLGSVRTGVSLEDVFSQEIRPCKRGTASLCARHQAATVRFLGLVLYPLGMVCELACGVVENVNVNLNGGNTMLGQKSGLLLGSGTYLLTTFCLWWYWFIMLPWVAIGGLIMSISFGWCFGLIELANI